MSRACPGRARHWRIIRGTIGLRSPVCVVCGSPNPRPLTDEEWSDLLYHVRKYGTKNEHVAAAIEARSEIA